MLSSFADSESRLLTLPSPPFTPASLHFVLGYIYCGTLEFSNRKFDLSTAMQIWRSAQFLGLDLLRNEVESRMEEMCRSREGNLRAPRILHFALSPDVRAYKLAKISRSIIASSVGETWGKDVGELDYDAQKQIVEDVCSGITPASVVSTLRASRAVSIRITQEKAPWADHLRSMLEPIEAKIRLTLGSDLTTVIVSNDFVNLIDGIGFSNDILDAVLSLLVQSLTERNAANAYQVLVGQVLLRDEGLTDNVRRIVEEARQGILRYLRSKWVGVQNYNAFEPLQDWALKEISDGKPFEPIELYPNFR
jgi:hypothetical protein